MGRKQMWIWHELASWALKPGCHSFSSLGPLSLVQAWDIWVSGKLARPSEWRQESPSGHTLPSVCPCRVIFSLQGPWPHALKLTLPGFPPSSPLAALSCVFMGSHPYSWQLLSAPMAVARAYGSGTLFPVFCLVSIPRQGREPPGSFRREEGREQGTNGFDHIFSLTGENCECPLGFSP